MRYLTHILVAALLLSISTISSAQTLRPETAAEVQASLAFLGFDPGGVDGAFGSGSRRALRIFQVSEGLNVTGSPDQATLSKLRGAVNAQMQRNIGANLSGRWGNRNTCTSAANHLIIRGIGVEHQPRWSSKKFYYVLEWIADGRFRTIWANTDSLENKAVDFDAANAVLRVPELDRAPLTRCQPAVATPQPTPTAPTTNNAAQAIDLLQQENAQLLKTINNSQRLAQRQANRIATIDATLNGLSQSSQALAAANRQRDRFKNQFDAASAENTELKAQIADLAAENQRLQNRAGSTRRGLLRDQLEAANADNQTLRTALTTANDRIRQANSQNADLAAENQRLINALNQRQGGGQQNSGGQNSGGQNSGGFRFTDPSGRFNFTIGQ